MEDADVKIAHRSPAAADGNELNISGCLGTGASLQRVINRRNTRVTQRRRTRSTGVAMPPPQLFSVRGRMSTRMKADRSLLPLKMGTSGGIDVVGAMAE